MRIPTTLSAVLIHVALFACSCAPSDPLPGEAGPEPRFTRAAGGAAVTDSASTGGVGWVDFDGDGDLDLFVGNWPNRRGPGELNELYVNEGGPGRWLEVALEGTRSNRSALGARIRVAARIRGTSRTQTRAVTAHRGFRSQVPLAVHFGLGDAAVVDTLLVSWPSGAETLLTGLEPGRRILVREAEGLVAP